jgi:hypothetical protein
MLWYKVWLETRFRFFLGIAAISALCAFYVFLRPVAVARWTELLRLHPDLHRPWWMNRAIAEYPFYIWRVLFDGQLPYAWAGFAVLIGIGGLTQECGRGTAGFTLSLPVPRRRLASAQITLSCLEVIVLGLLPAVLVPVVSHFVHQNYSVGEAMCRGLLMAIAGLTLFSLALLLSALSESPNVPLLVSISIVILLQSVVGPYENDLKEPFLLQAVDLFKVLSGPPDLHWRSFPWTGLLVSTVAALLLSASAIRVIQNRDYR